MNEITFYLLLLFSVSALVKTAYNISDPEQLFENAYAVGTVIKVYSLDGIKVIERILNTTSDELSIDTFSRVNGAYIVNLSNRNQVISKMVVILN